MKNKIANLLIFIPLIVFSVIGLLISAYGLYEIYKTSLVAFAGMVLFIMLLIGITMKEGES